MADKPVINFQTFPNENYDSQIVEKIGKKYSTNEEVNIEINKIYEDSSYNQTNSLNDFDQSVFDNLSNSSYQVMLYNINDLIKFKTTNNKKTKHINIFLIYLFEFLNYIIYNAKLPTRGLFFKDKYHQFKADSRSFSGFNKSQIIKQISHTNEIYNVKLKVSFISRRIFFIKK